MREPKLQNKPEDAARLMRQMGGSFVEQLGYAYRMADPENATKLRCAFPELFEKYDAMVGK